MKTFDQLTPEEKVILNSEQVQYYAKLECANRGIIIPQKPINEKKDINQPTQKYWQVGYESFVFETEIEAQNYIDVRNKSFKIRSVGNNYDNKNQYISERNKDYKEIKSIILYTKEEVTDLNDILIYNSEVSKEWNDYNDKMTIFNEIQNEFFEEIRELNYKNSRIDFYNKVYDEYLTLSEGNNDTAYMFFKKAYENIPLSDVDREVVDEFLINNRINDKAI